MSPGPGAGAARERDGGRRLRVLEVCGSAAGGVRSHVLECARLLAADRHDVVLLAPEQVLAGADAGGARTGVLRIGARPSFGDAAVLARLRRLGRRADVVHAHGLRAGALAALALGGRRPGRTRLVVTEHNLPVGGRLTVAVGERLAAVIAERADHVLVVSPDLARRARERGAQHVELAVVPTPPRSTDGLAPRASSIESAWRGGRARVLTVARLAPQKGLDLLLDAAALLADRLGEDGRGPLAWAVAGEGPERGALEERIGARGLPVRLLGRREDVPALLGAADVVVQTSLWEGQPIVVQEALRAGAAVVATDVGGTAQTARGGAVLVEPRAEALAGAVAALLGDPGALAGARRRSAAAGARLPDEGDLRDQLRRVVAAPPSGAAR